MPGGRPPEVGSLFIQPDYARTLRQVAERGADDFYGGELGRRIARFYEENGGLLSLDDLRQYRAKWLAPVSTTFRDYVIYTQPPNSSAVALLQELNTLR